MAASIIIDRDKTFQTMESFGVSGAWWAQSVGGWRETDENSSMPKRDRIAQLLFHGEEGIGISCYRYNLGSGSKNSGRGRYAMESRRAESFDTDDGRYDWSRDENAVYMMKKAAEYGADEIVLFVNSPPERFTRNGLGYQSFAGQTNLPRRNYGKFIKYTLDAAEHFISEGIPVKYISPVNEPVWFWTEKQEGCHYRPWQVKRLLEGFADEMEKRPALKDVKLSGAENGDIRWFNKTYCRIMLGSEKIRRHTDGVDTHSYFTKLPVPLFGKAVNDRVSFLRRYRKFIDKHYPEAAIRTSEWTHMKKHRDCGMDSALVQSKVIFEDLTILGVTSWQHWVALSDADYCDGLIYQFDDTRSFRLTKRYFAFGNFSKYIKRGSVRLEAVTDDPSLLTCAFKRDGELTVIIINPEKDEKAVSFPKEAGKVKMLVTSETDDLTKYDAEPNNILIKGKSVNTLIFK